MKNPVEELTDDGYFRAVCNTCWWAGKWKSHLQQAEDERSTHLTDNPEHVTYVDSIDVFDVGIESPPCHALCQTCGWAGRWSHNWQ